MDTTIKNFVRLIAGVRQRPLDHSSNSSSNNNNNQQQPPPTKPWMFMGFLRIIDSTHVMEVPVVKPHVDSIIVDVYRKASTNSHSSSSSPTPGTSTTRSSSPQSSSPQFLSGNIVANNNNTSTVVNQHRRSVSTESNQNNNNSKPILLERWWISLKQQQQQEEESNSGNNNNNMIQVDETEISTLAPLKILVRCVYSYLMTTDSVLRTQANRNDGEMPFAIRLVEPCNYNSSGMDDGNDEDMFLQTSSSRHSNHNNLHLHHKNGNNNNNHNASFYRNADSNIVTPVPTPRSSHSKEEIPFCNDWQCDCGPDLGVVCISVRRMFSPSSSSAASCAGLGSSCSSSASLLISATNVKNTTTNRHQDATIPSSLPNSSFDLGKPPLGNNNSNNNNNNSNENGNNNNKTMIIKSPNLVAVSSNNNNNNGGTIVTTKSPASTHTTPPLGATMTSTKSMTPLFSHQQQQSQINNNIHSEQMDSLDLLLPPAVLATNTIDATDTNNNKHNNILTMNKPKLTPLLHSTNVLAADNNSNHGMFLQGSNDGFSLGSRDGTSEFLLSVAASAPLPNKKGDGTKRTSPQSESGNTHNSTSPTSTPPLRAKTGHPSFEMGSGFHDDDDEEDDDGENNGESGRKRRQDADDDDGENSSLFRIGAKKQVKITHESFGCAIAASSAFHHINNNTKSMTNQVTSTSDNLTSSIMVDKQNKQQQLEQDEEKYCNSSKGFAMLRPILSSSSKSATSHQLVRGSIGNSSCLVADEYSSHHLHQHERKDSSTITGVFDNFSFTSATQLSPLQKSKENNCSINGEGGVASRENQILDLLHSLGTLEHVTAYGDYKNLILQNQLISIAEENKRKVSSSGSTTTSSSRNNNNNNNNSVGRSSSGRKIRMAVESVEIAVRELGFAQDRLVAADAKMKLQNTFLESSSNKEEVG